MSTGRYITGLVLGGIAGGAVLIFGLGADFGFAAVLLMYLAAATVCMTIWGSLGVRVFLFIAAWALSVLQIWWNFLCSGSILGFILAIVGFSFAFSLAGAILGVAVTVGIGIMAVTFPFSIFTTASDLY
ncbi:MAG: hypothetical protein J6K61_00295 [Clostridia bacterium]|nr:hypothetical protein [Clostridia bacterium]